MAASSPSLVSLEGCFSPAGVASQPWATSVFWGQEGLSALNNYARNIPHLQTKTISLIYTRDTFCKSSQAESVTAGLYWLWPEKQRELSSRHLTKNHLCYWWAKRRRHSMLSLPISTLKVSFAHVAYCLYLKSRSFSSASSVGIRNEAWKAAADTLICGQHLHAVADPQNRLSYCEDRWVEPRGIFCIHRVWSSRYNDSSADKR